jgi:membrane fusion protein, multidrug efflux system
MRTRIIILGLCMAVSTGDVAAWHTRHSDAAVQQPAAVAPVPVVAEQARVSDMPILLTGIGTVTAFNVVDVHAQVTGTIDKIGFTEGETVHPGSLIAQLDPRPFQASLQQAQAALARDTANLVADQENLGRYSTLLKQGFATQQQVTDQTSTVNALEASIASDKASIFNAQTQLGYTTIASPIDGVTGIQQIDIGNIVQPSSTTPIVKITQIQPISIIFTLPQDDLPAVRRAMAKGMLRVIAHDQNARTRLGEGTLLLVNNMVDQRSGAIQLKATFSNTARTLWPGEFVSVRLILDQQHDAISVPLDALQQGQDGPLVYVVAADSTVQQRAVTQGETLDGRAVIEKGLKPGDVVVTQGQYRLGNGVKVAPVPAGDPSVQNSTEASAGMLG